MGKRGNIVQFRHTVIDPKGPGDPHIKAVGDINGDGFIDVVIASSNGGPLVWYEYPTWIRHVIAPSGRWSTDAKLADMDGDGDLDIVISEWYTHNRIEWYENPLPARDPATSSWERHVIGNPRAHDIQVGDIDGDGELEIVTRGQGDEGNNIIVWKRVNASWTKSAINCPYGEGLALGDIDRDGKLDIVIGGRWYKNGTWKEHVFADWTPDAVVKTGDMNKDGRLDIILSRSEGHYRLSWFESPPDPASGEWIEHVVDSSLDFVHSIAICDMNNDGEPDIVTAEMHQSPRKRVMVYFNEGNAIKWKQHVIAITGSHNLCVADIGNNGTMDIIGANWSGNYQPIEMWEAVF